MRPLEEVLAERLGEHTTFGRSQQVHPADGPNCGYAVVRACRCGGWSAPVMRDDSDKAAHRAHLAAVAAQTVDEWLQEQREAVAEAIGKSLDAWDPTEPMSHFTEDIAAADAALAAVRGRISGGGR